VGVAKQDIRVSGNRFMSLVNCVSNEIFELDLSESAGMIKGK
jgi:hypothetical protein